MEKDKQNGPFEHIGEAMGGAVGKMMGRANDMAMSAAGSILTTAMGTLGAWWGSGEAQQASRSFSEKADRACREHFNSRSAARPSTSATSGSSDYERVRPLYEFGYVAGTNPEYQAKPFDRVESDLEKAWEALGRDRYGDWSEVRDQVSFGYTVRSSGGHNAT
jgi:hypothetical protein